MNGYALIAAKGVIALLLKQHAAYPNSDQYNALISVLVMVNTELEKLAEKVANE